jgi:hypothetical protein
MTNRRPDTIYIARPVNFPGPYKIGSTSDLKRRMRHINNASPFEMELVAAMPGDPILERRIHASLLDAHIRCEWFRDCFTVRSLVARVRDGTFDPAGLPQPKGVSSYRNGKPVQRRSLAA